MKHERPVQETERSDTGPGRPGAWPGRIPRAGTEEKDTVTNAIETNPANYQFKEVESDERKE